MPSAPPSDNSNKVVAMHDRPLRSSQAPHDSFKDIPIHDFTWTQEPAGPTLVLPEGRSIANHEGYFIAQDAVVRGKRKELEYALLACRDLDAIFRNGWTLLSGAAAEGRHDIVRTLLGYGANPNAKDKNQDGACAPLYWAARNCHIRVILILVAAGANVNATGLDNESALTAVLQYSDKVTRRHIKTIDLLLRVGANIDARKRRGDTIIEQAIQFRKPSLIIWLVRKGASVRGTLVTSVLYAGLTVLRLLICFGARDEEGDPALLRAIQLNKPRLVEELLKYVRKPYSSELRERINALDQAAVEPVRDLLLQHDITVKRIRDGPLFRSICMPPLGSETPTSVDEVGFTPYSGILIAGDGDYTPVGVSWLKHEPDSQDRLEAQNIDAEVDRDMKMGGDPGSRFAQDLMPDIENEVNTAYASGSSAEDTDEDGDYNLFHTQTAVTGPEFSFTSTDHVKVDSSAISFHRMPEHNDRAMFGWEAVRAHKRSLDDLESSRPLSRGSHSTAATVPFLSEDSPIRDSKPLNKVEPSTQGFSKPVGDSDEYEPDFWDGVPLTQMLQEAQESFGQV